MRRAPDLTVIDTLSELHAPATGDTSGLPMTRADRRVRHSAPGDQHEAGRRRRLRRPGDGDLASRRRREAAM
jgi:hypothetical protein